MPGSVDGCILLMAVITDTKKYFFNDENFSRTDEDRYTLQ